MEFRKMVRIILYEKQKKRHRCIEQTFGLCGRRRGWDVSREQHRNMHVIKDHQPTLDAWDKCSGLMHWEEQEGSGRVGGGRGGSGWGIHVYPRLIHVNVWQEPLPYCKVISLQLIKINGKNIYKFIFFNLVIVWSSEWKSFSCVWPFVTPWIV